MRKIRMVVAAAAAIGLAALTTLPAAAAPRPQPSPHPGPPATPVERPERNVCPQNGTLPACDSHIRTKADGVTPDGTRGPAGYGAPELQAAYNLTNISPNPNTPPPIVAVVDAYHNGSAFSNQQIYRAKMGLPPCEAATSTTPGCFIQVGQSGGDTPQGTDQGWAEESDLDVQMVAATCPYCRVMLVEANTNNWSDLTAAVKYAAGVAGVVAISNSYSAKEWSNEKLLETFYNNLGVAVTASAGDAGFGPRYPAASQYVTAVGGTTLVQDTSSVPRGWSETAWKYTGSGCSAVIPKPTWQLDNIDHQNKGCAKRAVADVSAVADTNTGVSVYSGGAWYVFGGTSVAAPIIAAIYALAGNPGVSATGTTNGNRLNSYPYANPGALNDIVTGKNKSTCGGATKNYLCNAGPGYDGPTGLGTPNGVGAFAPPSAT